MTEKARNSYWERRSAARMDEYQRGAARTVEAIRRAQSGAVSSLQSSINALFERYKRKYGLTREEAKAILEDYIDPKILENLKKAADKMPDGEKKRALEARVNAPSVRFRMTNMQGLQEQATAVCQTLEDMEYKRMTKQLEATCEEAYLGAEYDLQKGLGVMWSTTGISKRAVTAILTDDWSGRNYSQRLHRNTEKLARKAQSVVLQGFLGGSSRAEMAASLSKTFDENAMDAYRLITTEITHAANQAEMKRYKDNAIKRYMFRAVLDLRTSQKCQDHDGVIFNVEDAVTGVNFPPLHPWCRSTTIQVLSDKWIKTMTRTIRDPITGEVAQMPASMTYTEWKDKLVKKHGQDAVAKEQRRQHEEAKRKRELKTERAMSYQWADDAEKEVNRTEKNSSSEFTSIQKSGIIDIEIDELTPCLKRNDSGEFVDTEIKLIHPKAKDCKGWEFDWRTPEKEGYKVYALYAKGDERIQGMVSIMPEKGYYEVGLIESAPWNNRHSLTHKGPKEYTGVGGHLFAEACKQSYDAGNGGYIGFMAKTNLIDYYTRAFGAVQIYGQRMAIEEKEAAELIKIYYGR